MCVCAKKIVPSAALNRGIISSFAPDHSAHKTTFKKSKRLNELCIVHGLHFKSTCATKRLNIKHYKKHKQICWSFQPSTVFYHGWWYPQKKTMFQCGHRELGKKMQMIVKMLLRILNSLLKRKRLNEWYDFDGKKKRKLGRGNELNEYALFLRTKYPLYPFYISLMRKWLSTLPPFKWRFVSVLCNAFFCIV